MVNKGPMKKCDEEFGEEFGEISVTQFVAIKFCDEMFCDEMFCDEMFCDKMLRKFVKECCESFVIKYVMKYLSLNCCDKVL